MREDQSPRFNPATDVNYGIWTFTLPYDLGVATDDKVVYSSGGGTPIGGLVDGATYYAESVGSGNPTHAHVVGHQGRRADSRHQPGRRRGPVAQHRQGRPGAHRRREPAGHAHGLP